MKNTVIYHVLNDIVSNGTMSNKELSKKNEISECMLADIMKFLLENGYLQLDKQEKCDPKSFTCKHCPFAGKCQNDDYKVYTLTKKGKSIISDDS